MAYWDKLGSRGTVIDRRAAGPAAIGGLGVGGIALVLLFNLLTGGDGTQVLQQLEQLQVQSQPTQGTSTFAGADSYEIFASTVLGSNNSMWQGVFAQAGMSYREPQLVLFRGATQSACGGADARSGPHYCPLDATIYLDETFFDEMRARFGASDGDVAQAYVIAHEVGHHAQQELGLLDRADSVAVELQADCFAGLWAYSIKDLGVFEAGELQEAMDIAAAVGDDRIQEATTGRVSPESWTHGSSAQRVAAFSRGANSGSLAQCGVSR